MPNIIIQKKVAIIDYELGNLFSVVQACEHLGFKAMITNDKKDLLAADYAILPGVGAFGAAMKNLHKADLVSPIKDYIQSGKPFMGICLGLQLLLDESEEFGSNNGLGIIKGTVKKFHYTRENGLVSKVPQIQWNQIHSCKNNLWQASPLRHCANGDYMYFVHSFYAVPSDRDVILSETEYSGITYCSSIKKQNVFACQFHPEKSGNHGIEIYKNWLNG